MRIRKQNRKLGSATADVGLLRPREGDGRQKLSETDTARITATEQSALDGLTIISRQNPAPGVPVPQRGHVEPVSEPSKPDSQALLEGVRQNVDGGVEDSNLSGDPLWQTHENEHITRHYVRRGLRKGGDGPAPVQFESPLASARPAAAARSIVHEIIEDDGVNQCKSEEFMPPSVIKTEFPSSDIVAFEPNLLRTEACETDEDQDHPSKEPEGSLLHTLYLQLLAAGSEGITLRDLFTSFKRQTSLPSLASDWKEQVRAHLKNNPHFDELKGRYLLCEQLVQPKRSPVSLDRPYKGVSPRTFGCHVPSLRTTVKSPDSAAVHSAVSMEKHHEGVQTRRKAYEKTIEAVLSESVMEFEKMQQDLGNRQLAATESREPNLAIADPIDSQSPPAPPPVPHAVASPPAPLPVNRKRKTSSSDNEELDCFKNIRGSLKAMQARIMAESGVRTGAPCSRKDDARRWRCPLMAMEGHSLCEHHKSLQERKKAKKQLENRNRRSMEKESKPVSGPLMINRFKSDLQEPGSLSCGTHKEAAGIVAEHGNAVQALIDLRGRVPEGECKSSQNTIEAEAITGDASKVQQEEHAATDQDEEAEPRIFHNDSSKAVEVPTTPALNGTFMISKDPTDDEEELDHITDTARYERAIPGSLKALQARIIAESGVQSGVRCARKDGSSDSARKWQCPLTAMEGHTLCEHHNLLKERKRARAKRQSEIKARLRRDRDHANGGGFGVLKTSIPLSNSLPAERCRTEDEEQKVPAHRDPQSILKDSMSPEDDDHGESTDTDDDLREAKEKLLLLKDEDPNTEKLLLPQVFRNAPKRRYIAAKKTATNVEVVQGKSLERESAALTRAPTIPPLPAVYGVRRKAIKNRSLLSL